jgi:hypothetical protein
MRYLAIALITLTIENIFGNNLQCDLGRGKRGVCVSSKMCASFDSERMYFEDNFCNNNYALFCCERLRQPSTTNPTTTTSTTEKSDPESDYEYEEKYSIDEQPTPTCGSVLNSFRISNGFNAELLEFPWIALIGYGRTPTRNFGCGGSLINGHKI